MRTSRWANSGNSVFGSTPVVLHLSQPNSSGICCVLMALARTPRSFPTTGDFVRGNRDNGQHVEVNDESQSSPISFLQFAVADRPTLLNLPAGLGNETPGTKVPVATYHSKSSSSKGIRSATACPSRHNQHLFVLRLAYGCFPGGVFSPYHSLHRWFLCSYGSTCGVVRCPSSALVTR